jgi:hypothetical protein
MFSHLIAGVTEVDTITASNTTVTVKDGESVSVVALTAGSVSNMLSKYPRASNPPAVSCDVGAGTQILHLKSITLISGTFQVFYLKI